MMKNRSHFYDPLYDYVTFEEAEAAQHDGLSIFRPGFGRRGDSIHTKHKSKQILPFLDTIEVNRLNFLRQSGLAFLVYPSSTHTRFAHSIGSCYLGFIAGDQIRMQEEKHARKNGVSETIIEENYLSEWLDKKGWREEFLLALLLHDLGHFPFSHTLEGNWDFWAAFPKRISHEELTCELIIGDPKSELFQRYRSFVESRIDPAEFTDKKYKFVSDLIAKGRRKGINTNILCYLISGKDMYFDRVSDSNRRFLVLAHNLVSGLLDLDRIDHYRRDSYYTGLKFGSNVNFAGLLGGMTLHYYDDASNNKNVNFELRLSADAIGHALTLLHSKERLVQDCFDHPVNISYDAMLHSAINMYVGVDCMNGKNLDHEQVEKAYELFFITDDELLWRLIDQGNKKVKEIVFRIQNRRPFTYLGRGVLKSTKDSLLKLRNDVIRESAFCEYDFAFRPAKHYGSRKNPTDEWLHLDYLYNEKGNKLSDDQDYGEQIKYFKSLQDRSRDVVWFFTDDASKADQLSTIFEKKVERYVNR